MCLQDEVLSLHVLFFGGVFLLLNLLDRDSGTAQVAMPCSHLRSHLRPLRQLHATAVWFRLSPRQYPHNTWSTSCFSLRVVAFLRFAVNVATGFSVISSGFAVNFLPGGLLWHVGGISRYLHSWQSTSSFRQVCLHGSRSTFRGSSWHCGGIPTACSQYAWWRHSPPLCPDCAQLAETSVVWPCDRRGGIFVSSFVFGCGCLFCSIPVLSFCSPRGRTCSCIVQCTVQLNQMLRHFPLFPTPSLPFLLLPFPPSPISLSLPSSRCVCSPS